jgi:hypothetical protein
MVNNVDHQLRSLRNIAHMTIINAIFSIVIGVSFYFNIALTNAGGIPVALQNNPVVYIPSWVLSCRWWIFFWCYLCGEIFIKFRNINMLVD